MLIIEVKPTPKTVLILRLVLRLRKPYLRQSFVVVWVACRTLLSACARDTSGFPAAASDGDIHSDGGVASGIHANDVRLQVKYLGIVCLRVVSGVGGRGRFFRGIYMAMSYFTW